MHLSRSVHDLTYHIFLHPLSYFCADVSQHISYKTLKVYLAGIRLLDIKHGFPDPTDDRLLELVYRGIRRQQGDHQQTRLPMTINHLRANTEEPIACVPIFIIRAVYSAYSAYSLLLLLHARLLLLLHA